MTQCPDCGARYAQPTDSCQGRFDTLLALDHSHREPWGSRHALAFATYALQHPSGHSRATRAYAHELLRRVAERGEPLAAVVADFRARQVKPSDAVDATAVPPMPAQYAVTIADLGDFAAETYVPALERWVAATIEGLQSGPSSA